MKRYLVEVTVTFTQTYDIEADNEPDAVNQAMLDAYQSGRNPFYPYRGFRQTKQGRVVQELTPRTVGVADSSPL